MSGKQAQRLFLLCWWAYFSTYLGRLNYSAALTEIISSEGFDKGQAGIIGTGFFFAYGVGQFVSGFLGDRVSVKKMVFTGLFFSGLCNLLMSAGQGIGFMTAIWCVNGLVQSLIWSPLLRLVSEHCQDENRQKVCAVLNSSVPAGTMAAYGITAAMLAFTGWRQVFLLAGGYLLAVSFVWLFHMRRAEKEPIPSAKKHLQKQGTGAKLLQGADTVKLFGCLLVVLLIQGTLKDGVTVWVPVYIRETYGVSAVLAIAGTIIIPLCNLSGVFFASKAGSRRGMDEVKASAIFFAVCTAALAVLRGISGHSMPVSFGMLAISTTAMMAVNTMLIVSLPSCFEAVGRTSSVSGLLNSAVYAGGALSTYGIGWLAEKAGWERTILIWACMAAVSVILCVMAVRKWQICRQKLLEIKSEQSNLNIENIAGNL